MDLIIEFLNNPTNTLLLGIIGGCLIGVFVGIPSFMVSFRRELKKQKNK